MNFIDEIENITTKNNNIKMFIDMDGTVVEYIFDEIDSYSKKGGYIRKRPINIILEKINKVNELFNNVELFILSCSSTHQMAKEKDIWLDKYMPYIDSKRRIYLIKEDGGYTKDNMNTVKAQYIKSILKDDEKAILIDDDSNILRQCQKILGDKISLFHVTSLLF